MKTLLIVLMILSLQIFSYPVAAIAEENDKKLENSATEALETFAAVLQQVHDSMYIVIDDKNTVYLHDSSTCARPLDKSKKISLAEMDNKVRKFAKKKDGPNLHSVFLVIAENVPFKYLYEVIRCYEKAVYNNTGSDIVEYRFTSPLNQESIKATIK